MPPVTTPKIDSSILALDALQAVMPGDLAFFAIGTFDDYAEANDETLISLLPRGLVTVFSELGELAESPTKIDSKNEPIKTRRYRIPGCRTSTVELTLAGLSPAQKNYLESDLFSGQQTTILLLGDDYLSIYEHNDALRKAEEDDIDLYLPIPAVILNGMSWTVDWSADADGLWTVVIASEITGSSDAVIPYSFQPFVYPAICL